MKASLKEIGEPEQVKPPDRIGEKSGNEIGPGGAGTEQFLPWDGGRSLSRRRAALLDVFTLTS
jgi:hypothetical protein